MINTKNELLTNAINTKNVEDWHLFKNQNNIINKKIKEAKTNYYKEKFENNNNKWKTLKNINNTNKQTPPNIINNNGKLISSPKLIANIANNYFIEKIKQIRNKFITDNANPINILETLIKKPKTIFNLQLITIKKTKKLIKKLPNSKCTGYDAISNKIIKKCGNTIIPHITHLINSIIRKGIFPEIFKISRIFPISKNGKPKEMISSFRPLNNLVCLEKIIEHYFKEQLEAYFEGNHFLSLEHHGGRYGYSTLTALTKIHNEIYKNKEKNKLTGLITTDLTAAFDTVDHTF